MGDVLKIAKCFNVWHPKKKKFVLTAWERSKIRFFSSSNDSWLYRTIYLSFSFPLPLFLFLSLPLSLPLSIFLSFSFYFLERFIESQIIQYSSRWMNENTKRHISIYLVLLECVERDNRTSEWWLCRYSK